MSDAYQNALGTVADAYEAEVLACGGKSLSRVATIVASSGSFFQRLREGKSFSVANLDKFTMWFREPTNWPNGTIPSSAVDALCSMGRPPLHHQATHICVTKSDLVACDRRPISQRSAG